MTNSRWIGSAAAIACVCCGLIWIPPASAQTRSLFGPGGTGRGSAANGSAVGGTQAAGRSGNSLFGGGTTGRGTTSGRAGTMASPLQTMGGRGGSSMGAAPGGTQGFVGRGDGGSGFVGRQGNGQGAARGNQFRGTANNFQNQFGNLGNRGFGRTGVNGFNNFNQGANRGQSTTLGTFRPQQRIAFEYPSRAPVQIDRRLETRFITVVGRRTELSGVNVGVADGGRVVLRGQVPTPEARKLAENLVRLEPGVRDIQNELTVATPPPAAP